MGSCSDMMAVRVPSGTLTITLENRSRFHHTWMSCHSQWKGSTRAPFWFEEVVAIKVNKKEGMKAGNRKVPLAPNGGWCHNKLQHSYSLLPYEASFRASWKGWGGGTLRSRWRKSLDCTAGRFWSISSWATWKVTWWPRPWPSLCWSKQHNSPFLYIIAVVSVINIINKQIVAPTSPGKNFRMKLNKGDRKRENPA